MCVVRLRLEMIIIGVLILFLGNLGTPKICNLNLEVSIRQIFQLVLHLCLKLFEIEHILKFRKVKKHIILVEISVDDAILLQTHQALHEFLNNVISL